MFVVLEFFEKRVFGYSVKSEEIDSSTPPGKRNGSGVTMEPVPSVLTQEVHPVVRKVSTLYE